MNPQTLLRLCSFTYFDLPELYIRRLARGETVPLSEAARALRRLNDLGALLCHPETRFYVRQNPGTNAHSPDAFAFDAEGFPIPARRTWLSRAVEALSRLLLALETLGFTNVTRRLLACPAPA